MATPTAKLSNWNRWGSDDERGTANLLNDAAVLNAASLVRTGRVFTLSQTLEFEAPIVRHRNRLWHRTSVFSYGKPDEIQTGSADDLILMHTHGSTHIDALCHIWYDGLLYNGFPASESLSMTEGARRNGVHNIGVLAGRGVLLDIARHRGVEHLDVDDEIAATELTECAEAQGVEIRPGDSVLIRTGWIRVFSGNRPLYDSGAPGVTLDAAQWFRDHDLCAMGADTVAVEKFPMVMGSMVFHLAVIRDLGGYLLEFLNLEDLAAASVHEFLLIVAPLRLRNGIGSPVNPIAIA